MDAYHYPTALKDFNVFSNQFGLPTEGSTNATASTNTVFQVVYASGSKPRTNGGWAQEAALDIEWAHAMAPGAKIYLIEAASNSYASLFAAVDKARSLPGVKQVFYGICLAAVIIYLPHGIWPPLRRKLGLEKRP